MAISLDNILLLDTLGIFQKEKLNIVDIGSSNLQWAKAEKLIPLIRKYNREIDDGKLESVARRLEAGSGYSPETGGGNQAWAGEVFELCGMHYTAFDISEMYKVRLFDLNSQNVTRAECGSADVVLNFGTTEHVFNQLNAFTVIHDLCSKDGFIVHLLPCSGYCDHGFFQYTGRFFYELAGANEYEIIHSSYTEPMEFDLYASSKQYANIFHKLECYVDIPSIMIPSYCQFLILKKIHDKPFSVSLETSTTVNKDIAFNPIENFATHATTRLRSLLGFLGKRK